MLTPERMKEVVPNYLIQIDEDTKSIAITKGGRSDWIRISVKRAIDWVNAGIEDLDGRSQDELLEILENWDSL